MIRIKNFFAFLMISMLLILSSCQTQISDSNDNKIITTTKNISDNEVKLLQMKAQARLNEMASYETEKNWTSESKITNWFPLYKSGIDGVAYIEFKVKTNNNDSGYILVSNGDHDSHIPELSTTGLTLTEEYMAFTGKSDISVLRYDYFSSVAFKNNNYISYTGIDSPSMKLVSGNNEITQKLSTKTSDAAIINKKSISTINANKNKKNDIAPSKSSTASVPKIVNSRVDLKNKTPIWTQSWNDNYSVGCGAAAWSIVYGYWYQYKGHNNLFPKTLRTKISYYTFLDGISKVTAVDKVEILKAYKNTNGTYYAGSYDLDYYYNWDINGTNYNTLYNTAKKYDFLLEKINLLNIPKYKSYSLYSSPNACDIKGSPFDMIYSMQWQLFKQLLSWNISSDGSTATLPGLMQWGKIYAENRGYNVSVGWKSFSDSRFNWTEVSNMLYNEISSDRPAIVYMCTKGSGLGDHYVVVDAVEKRYWDNTGIVTELGLLVNWGHGKTDKNKWIYPFIEAFSGNSITSTYDCYSIDIN